MKKCYCAEVKLHCGESSRCEWCAASTERSRCAAIVRGAVPMPLHARTQAQKSAMTFVAEQFFRIADRIEKGN